MRSSAPTGRAPDGTFTVIAPCVEVTEAVVTPTASTVVEALVSRSTVPTPGSLTAAGVGVAVSNALSKRMEVAVYRGGERHTIVFEGGELSQKLKSEKSKEGRRTGTVVRMWPDPKYFDSPNIPAGLIHRVGSLRDR